jgi:hypothetical protein
MCPARVMVLQPAGGSVDANAHRPSTSNPLCGSVSPSTIVAA